MSCRNSDGVAVGSLVRSQKHAGKEETGFVRVALVADMDARVDSFDGIDEWAQKWADAQLSTSSK